MKMTCVSLGRLPDEENYEKKNDKAEKGGGKRFVRFLSIST